MKGSGKHNPGYSYPWEYGPYPYYCPDDYDYSDSEYYEEEEEEEEEQEEEIVLTPEEMEKFERYMKQEMRKQFKLFRAQHHHFWGPPPFPFGYGFPWGESTYKQHDKKSPPNGPPHHGPHHGFPHAPPPGFPHAPPPGFPHVPPQGFPHGRPSPQPEQQKKEK